VLARRHLVAVDLAQHVLGVRLVVLTVLGVVPLEVAQRPVLVVGRVRVMGEHALGEVVHEVQL
jgi:hypothetical protein